jgi:hypothetical protein
MDAVTGKLTHGNSALAPRTFLFGPLCKIVNFNQMDLFQQRRIHRICEDVLMAMVIYDVYLVITYFLRRAFHDKIGIEKYPTFEFLR